MVSQLETHGSQTVSSHCFGLWKHPFMSMHRHPSNALSPIAVGVESTEHCTKSWQIFWHRYSTCDCLKPRQKLPIQKPPALFIFLLETSVLLESNTSFFFISETSVTGFIMEAMIPQGQHKEWGQLIWSRLEIVGQSLWFEWFLKLKL